MPFTAADCSAVETGCVHILCHSLRKKERLKKQCALGQAAAKVVDIFITSSWPTCCIEKQDCLTPTMPVPVVITVANCPPGDNSSPPVPVVTVSSSPAATDCSVAETHVVSGGSQGRLYTVVSFVSPFVHFLNPPQTLIFPGFAAFHPPLSLQKQDAVITPMVPVPVMTAAADCPEDDILRRFFPCVHGAGHDSHYRPSGTRGLEYSRSRNACGKRWQNYHTYFIYFLAKHPLAHTCIFSPPFQAKQFALIPNAAFFCILYALLSQNNRTWYSHPW